MVVDLTQFGWKPPRDISNREFFRDFTLAKLFALDENTKIIFLTEDVIVAYHTKHDSREWRTANRTIEAFFLSAKDGNLLAVKSWPTGVRKANDDHTDSQARMVPLSRGRLLVVSNGTIMLYGHGFDLIHQKKLEPAVAADMWAVQSINSGKGIVVRHESGPQSVEYQWLDPDTLETRARMQDCGRHDCSIRAGSASESAIFAWSKYGIRMVALDQHERIICDDALCRDAGAFHLLSPEHLAVRTRNGIGIVDTARGLVWSKLVPLEYAKREINLGEIRSSLSGAKFVLWIEGSRKAQFDAVTIKEVTFLIYDVASLNDPPAVVRMKPTRPDWDSALSPSGTQFAVFDGMRLRIYSLN